MVAIERLLGLIASALMLVRGLALVAMMVHVTVDVVGKYFFNAPVPVTLEMVSNYYMVAVVFLPLGAVERAGGNIHVELVYAALPRLGRRLLDVLAYGLGAVFFWMLTSATWRVAVRKFEVGEFIMGSYSVIIWPSRFLVPVGAALITAMLVLKLVRSALAIVRPGLDPDLTAAAGPAAKTTH